MKLIRAAALAILMSASFGAFADCGGGNGPNDPPSEGCVPGNPGNGGQGGNGGTGIGVGVGIGVGHGGNADSRSNATGGSVIGSGNSTLRNTNLNWNDLRNTNRNDLTNTSSNVNNASATGGTSSVSNSGNSSSTSSSSSGGNTLSVTTVNPGTVAYSGSYKVRSAPTVFTPNAYPTAPCIIGLSAGGSGIGFGLSFGTGRKDEDCTRRENARRLAEQGELQGATSLMCQDPDVYKAMKRRCDIAMAGEDDYVAVTPVVEKKEVPVTDKAVTE